MTATTLYLSRVSVPDTTDHYRMHKVVEDLFEGDGGVRKVFRIRDGSLAVISTSMPKESCFDRDVRVLHTKEVVPPAPGSMVPFQLLFNPVRSYGQGQGKKSVRKGVWLEKEAKEWLASRLASSGVAVESLVVNRTGLRKYTKPNGVGVSAVEHLAVGILRVDDPSAFMDVVASGIGGCKFMGYGMIETASML